MTVSDEKPAAPGTYDASFSCSAGCKRQAADMDAALALGWSHLPISTRWRCPACTNELAAVGREK